MAVILIDICNEQIKEGWSNMADTSDFEIMYGYAAYFPGYTQRNVEEAFEDGQEKEMTTKK